MTVSKHVGIAWTTAGLVASLALTIAFTVLGYSSPDFDLARTCFWASAGAIVIAAIVLFVDVDWSFWQRALAAGVVGAATLILLVEGLRLVRRREVRLSEHDRKAAASVASTEAAMSPLKGEIAEYHGYETPGVTDVYFLVSIVNTGPPTIAGGFTPLLIHNNNKIQGEPTLLRNDNDYPDGVVFRTEYAIYNKVLEPIPTGGIAIGWFRAVFRGQYLQLIDKAEAEVRLYFRDARGLLGFARYRGAKRPPKLYPGVQNPVIQRPPLPPTRLAKAFESLGVPEVEQFVFSMRGGGYRTKEGDKFLAYYLPANPDPSTYEILKSMGKVKPPWPGKYKTVFYHEDPLTSTQKRDLMALYRSSGINVEFKGNTKK